MRLGSLITLFRRQNGIPSENHYDTRAIQTANDTFKAIAQEVVVSDWVGLLSAHIFWKRQPDTRISSGKLRFHVQHE